jgi:hypothetical protein
MFRPCVQGPTLTRYNAPLTLTMLICFVGTLQAIVVTLAMEHTTDVWKIGFDMNLLAAAYAVSLSDHILAPSKTTKKHGMQLIKKSLQIYMCRVS